MKSLQIIFCMVFFYSCQTSDIGNFIKDDKLKNDVENVANDAVNILEDTVKDETGINIQITLPQDKNDSNATSK